MKNSITFFLFSKKKIVFEILRSEAIFTLSSLSSSFTRLDHRHNAFNIANKSLHGFSPIFLRSLCFLFIQIFKFDVRNLVISFNKQSHKFLTRSEFTNRRRFFVDRPWRIVLLKVAFMLLAVLEILPNNVKIMPEFPTYAPDFRNYAHKLT